MKLPGNLKRLVIHEGGEAWLEELPRLLSQITEAWNLEVGPAYAGSNTAYVAPAKRGGENLVLKIQWPHEECEFEAEALKVWNGDGAIRLLDHDRSRHALLLERCSPGTSLSEQDGEEALSVLIGLLPKLWKPVRSPFRSLREEAESWSGSLIANWEKAGRPFERKLVDAAADNLAYLPSSQGEEVLIHQDLHADNVLASDREPWLAIDPKPLAGEREFAAAPIIRSFELGHSRAEVLYRLDRLSGELGLDRERCKGWTVSQTVVWSLDSEYPQHVETIKWLLE